MRAIMSTIVLVMVTGGTGVAQTVTGAAADDGGTASVVVRAPREADAPKPPPRAASPGTARIDVGPNTPEANAAYQGGGMILEGPPGAPAPTPEATPPGQKPRFMVEPGS
jgi:hypothetical protein